MKSQPRFPVSEPEAYQRGEPTPFPAPAQRLPVLVAVRRHLAWVVIPAVLLLGAGIAVGVVRSPTYTAESSLIIGSSDPASPNFGGNVVAAGALATAYSRAIIATPVVDTVSGRLHLSRSTVTASLSSAPVPNSPAFRVIATAKSSSSAISMTNAANTAIINYVGVLNSGSLNTQRLLKAYQAASVKVNRDVAALTDAQSAPTPNTAAINAAKAVRDRDQLVLSSLGAAYTAALQANPPITGISTLTTAFSATSDRKSMMELLGFVGFVVGTLVGVALAMLMGAREVRRATMR